MADRFDKVIRGNILTLSDSRPQVEAVGVKNGVIHIIGNFQEVEKYAGKDTSLLICEIKPSFQDSSIPTRILSMSAM